ncbi:MAG: hypothetical protein NTZ40_07705 [Cyanobacteria bacterium]|nr:hypothetical protein [Cyanobacteriota bacterium]
MLRRLLLLPLLSPLLAAAILGALNPTPVLSLRLLTWSSPALPLGAWIAGAALGGAVLSGAGASLALRPPAAALRRRVRLERATPGWEATPSQEGGHRRPSPSPGRSAQGRGADPAEAYGRGSRASASATAPTPAPGEPLPTMTVPFRVIRRADGVRPHAAAAAVAGPWSRSPGAEPQAGAQAGRQPDDWDSPADEDW